MLIHRTDSDGQLVWEKAYTSNQGPPYENNAGEYILTTRAGHYAVFVDSQSCGVRQTGGNFALMKLRRDDVRDTKGKILPSELLPREQFAQDEPVEAKSLQGMAFHSAEVVEHESVAALEAPDPSADDPSMDDPSMDDPSADDVVHPEDSDEWRRQAWSLHRADHVSWLREQLRGVG